MPDGVVNVVPTNKPGPLTEAVLADPRVRKLSFTGSTEVGRMLLKQAADYVINCSMELGGNAPFLVFDDADVDAAVEGAFLAKMRNGGEACTAANRFYVHEKVAAEFSAKLAAKLAALHVGPGLEDGVDLGPLVNADTRSKVAELVESATGDGAQVLTGGHAPDRVGYLLRADRAGQRARGRRRSCPRRYSGRSRPSSGSPTRKRRSRWPTTPSTGWCPTCTPATCAARCKWQRRWRQAWWASTGASCLDPAAPFGGVKQSGLGREGAHDGLLEYTETKYIAVDW